MQTPFPRTLNRCLRSFGFLAVWLCFNPSLHAGPVIFPGKVENSVLAVYVGVAIFLEAACVAWLLRKFHRPPLFILWVLATHLLTFPVFLGVIWLLEPWFRYFTIALAAGVVVLAEGRLIYQICRRPSSLAHLPLPSVGDCWFVALISNACSAAGLLAVVGPFYRPVRLNGVHRPWFGFGGPGWPECPGRGRVFPKSGEIVVATRVWFAIFRVPFLRRNADD